MSVRSLGGAGHHLAPPLPLDGCTRSVPACSPACPPLTTWGFKALIMGECPVCGRYSPSGVRHARALRALRLLERL
jgi:hypothetical protein